MSKKGHPNNYNSKSNTQETPDPYKMNAQPGSNQSANTTVVRGQESKPKKSKSGTILRHKYAKFTTPERYEQKGHSTFMIKRSLSRNRTLYANAREVQNENDEWFRYLQNHCGVSQATLVHYFELLVRKVQHTESTGKAWDRKHWERVVHFARQLIDKTLDALEYKDVRLLCNDYEKFFEDYKDQLQDIWQSLKRRLVSLESRRAPQSIANNVNDNDNIDDAKVITLRL
eukprot:789736_1